MITLKEWMELINYRITGGSPFEWNCYGDHAHALDSWNKVQGDDGFSISVVFDTNTQVVYEVTACDYVRNRAYRIINPSYKLAYEAEAKAKLVSLCQAWDDVDFVDLDSDDDWLTKARAIQAGEDYDTRVTVTVDFTDEELLKYMKLAHEQDITFNQFIERALEHILRESDFDDDLSK